MKILENGKIVDLREGHPCYKLINQIKQANSTTKNENQNFGTGNETVTQ